jgi:hypothetical protein
VVGVPTRTTDDTGRCCIPSGVPHEFTTSCNGFVDGAPRLRRPGLVLGDVFRT